MGSEAEVALHDLTGFEALLFCRDPQFVPVDDVAALSRFRRALLHFPEELQERGTYNLVVIGAGLAGICAALSGARQGLKVALVHDRPVLGGNASSEVRLRGTVFADCTGDAVVGYQAGADDEFAVGSNMGSSHLWRPMDVSKEEDVLHCECKDKDALTAAFEAGETEQVFPRCPWAIDLSDKPFPGRKGFKGQWGGSDPLANLGGWFWESGFDKDPIEDIEKIRDLNLRAMYGAWDALKNVDRLYPHHRLGWAAFIAGKRESRRLLGDVILTADDFRAGKVFEDPAFPCSWHIDLHEPDGVFSKEVEGEEFISRATEGRKFSYQGPYWAPYRVLYSRNLSNLFMAGRNISVSKEGLGPVRVMRTTGMMGEVVGEGGSALRPTRCGASRNP